VTEEVLLLSRRVTGQRDLAAPAQSIAYEMHPAARGQAKGRNQHRRSNERLRLRISGISRVMMRVKES